MLTAAEYFESNQQATLQYRLANAATVTTAELDQDVEYGALTPAQRQQVLDRQAEIVDEDVA